jgi:predicted N-formylglutamate amidohydrolase
LAGTVSRLLIELNKSQGHPRLFSDFSSGLSGSDKALLLNEYYLPHRAAVRAAIAGQARGGRRSLHIAVHSFTPRLAGEARSADVGLLYDPNRTAEKDLCLRWKAALKEVRPELRVRRNYPYLGVEDGLTTALRCDFQERQYLGIELEVNQALLTGRGATRKLVADALLASLRTAARF